MVHFALPWICLSTALVLAVPNAIPTASVTKATGTDISNKTETKATPDLESPHTEDDLHTSPPTQNPDDIIVRRANRKAYALTKPQAIILKRNNPKKTLSRSTSSSSGEKKQASNSESSGSGADKESLGLTETSSSSSSEDNKSNMLKKKKHTEPKSTQERHGWRKWHRKCYSCPQDIKIKWRDHRIKWICGMYQRAQRSFKSNCMMRYRNCQDGTMFIKIHGGRCKNDTGRESQPHGEHFMYEYSVRLSEESSDSGDSSGSSDSESSSSSS